MNSRSSDHRFAISLEVLSTALAAGVLLLCNVPMARFLVQGLGEDGFGIFQMTRRLAFFMYPLFLLGLDTSLVRNLPLANGNHWDRGVVIRAGGMLSLLGVALAALVGLLGGEWISRLSLNRDLPGFGLSLWLLLTATKPLS